MSSHVCLIVTDAIQVFQMLSQSTSKIVRFANVYHRTGSFRIYEFRIVSRNDDVHSRPRSHIDDFIPRQI